MAFVKAADKSLNVARFIVAKIGWDIEAFEESFLNGFNVMVDKDNCAVTMIPAKTSKATNEFQREFVRAARAAGYKSNYSHNSGIWVCYKKAEPKV